MSPGTLFERSRSVSRVGRTLEILIALKTIVASLAMYWMVRELIVLVRIGTSGEVDGSEIRGVVEAERFVTVLNTPLLFGTIFVWLIWQFFLHDLIVETSTTPPPFGRWASVGWWFVPFANLVMPYRVMRTLWFRVAADDDGRTLLRWWIPWNAQVALLYVMLLFAGRSIDAEIARQVLGIAAEAFFLLSTIPAIAVVRTLTQRTVSSIAVATASAAETVGDVVPPRVDLREDPSV